MNAIQKIWLGISATLNLALLGLLAMLAMRRADSQRISPAAAASTGSGPAHGVEAAAQTSPAVAANSGGDWIHTLRASGAPEKLIAEFAAADYEARWQKRERELERQLQHGDIDPDTMAQFQLDHDVDEEKEMRAALGDEGFLRWDRDRLLGEFNSAGLKLSDSESDALYKLRKDLDAQRHELAEARVAGEMDEAETERQTDAAQNEYDRQLKTLLGNDRYAATQNTSGSNTGELRRTLLGMHVGDVQLDSMMQAQQQWSDARAKLEQQLQSGGLSATDYDQQQKALDAARDLQYQQALGTNGFADFQKAEDERYRTMKHYATAWGLSDSDIDNLYSTLQSYESNVRDYEQRANAAEQQGQSVDWPAVRKTIQDFSQQTEQALRKYLGDDRFNKLKQNNVIVSTPAE